MSKSYLTSASISAALVLAALTGGTGHLAAQQDSAVAAPVPALDEATIVAIFDNANSFDIETGEFRDCPMTRDEFFRLAHRS